ncbi:hypothetical protein CEV08_07670 [Bartonella tribocorum]|uniref:Uncharacterized protein n=1 Tax=Bartonella tribocorum TaxID=85701 RepID=A0A2M6UR21_9HYPH|nr:hypothetical protein CEV08_07670 [Bartonella tribocorum]
MYSVIFSLLCHNEFFIRKSFKQAICSVALTISLTACGKRLEKNISTTYDGTMSCTDIQREFFTNKHQINDIIIAESIFKICFTNLNTSTR